MKKERQKYIEWKEELAYLDNEFKKQTAELIARKFDELHYSSCLDLGCGLIKYPLKGTTTVDGNSVCRPDILADLGEFKKFGSFDLVFSIEVAEHIEPEFEENFIKNLTENSNKWIVITASPITKEKSEYCKKAHLNEQPKEYWINKIEAKGFKYQAELTKSFQDYFRDKITPIWFARDLMIFKKEVSEYRLWYNDWISKNAHGKILDVGKSIYWDYGFPTIDINAELKPTFVGSIEKTNFEDKEFDLVLCNGMFECVENPQQMVNECLRIGKKVLFGFVGKDYPPYKDNWKFYDNNIQFSKVKETKDFNKHYHFILCE